jgi:hypothetical protein
MECLDIVLPQGLFDGKVTTCLLQLRSPFFLEADIIYGAQFPVLGWLQNKHKERKVRLRRCLEDMRGFERHIDLMVLPEYAISQDMFDVIEEFVQGNRTVVIGSFYDVCKRTGNAFAIFPTETGSTVALAPKCQRSPYEADVLRDLEENDKHLLRLRWSVKGKTMSLLVLPCLDFLGWPDLPLEIKDSDWLVSPMCTPKVGLFHSTAENATRWIPQGKTRARSRICVLCNTVEISATGLKTAGGSCVLGPKRGFIPVLPSGREAGIVVDIDCCKLITVPTPITGEDGTVIEAPARFFLEQDWHVRRTQLREKKPLPYSVHPGAVLRVGLQKYYLFVSLRDFWRHRDGLRDLPVGCSAIYGVHDLILHSFEDSFSFLKLRVQAWVEPALWRNIEEGEESCLCVTEVIKFRGRWFAETTSDSKQGYYRTSRLSNLGLRRIEIALKQIRSMDEGDDLTEDARNSLLEDGLLMDDLDDADILDIDTAQRRSEYIILVFLTDAMDGKNPARVFEEEVIAGELEIDQRVRTIEICQPVFLSASSYLRAHYILHIVGYIKDLSEIVLEKIHRKLGKLGLECGTRVIPVAERLSSDPEMTLSETRIPDTIAKEKICEIIAHNVNEDEPFAIRKLNEEEIERIANIWRMARTWGEFRESKGMKRQAVKHIRHELARAMYYISHSLVQSKETFGTEMLLNLWSYCGKFYGELVGDVEGYLKYLLGLASESTEDGFREQLSDAWRQGTKKQETIEFPDLDRITLGNLIQCIIYWNQMVSSKKANGSSGGYIGSLEYSNKLRKLQSLGIADFRDAFAHPSEGNKSAMKKHLKDKKDAKKLLICIHECLYFLLQERYGRIKMP